MVNDHHVLLCYLESIFRSTDAPVCCGSVSIFKDSSNFQMFHQKATIGWFCVCVCVCVCPRNEPACSLPDIPFLGIPGLDVVWASLSVIAPPVQLKPPTRTVKAASE